MSLVLGQNPSNELKPIELTNTGLLKVEVDSGGSGVGVDLEKVGGSAISLGNNSNANSIPVTLSSDGNQATASLQTAGNTSLATLAGAVDGTEFQCDVVSSALPTGAATSALQTTGNSSLSTIASDTSSVDAKLPASLGQKAMSASLAVAIASDQSAISVSSAGGNTTNTNETLTPGSGGTGNSTAQDMNGFSQLTIFGNSSNTSDQINLQISHNGSLWYDDQAHFVSQNSSGDFVVYVVDSGARYYRITQTDTQTSAYTMVINSSKK